MWNNSRDVAAANRLTTTILIPMRIARWNELQRIAATYWPIPWSIVTHHGQACAQSSTGDARVLGALVRGLVRPRLLNAVETHLRLRHLRRVRRHGRAILTTTTVASSLRHFVSVRPPSVSHLGPSLIDKLLLAARVPLFLLLLVVVPVAVVVLLLAPLLVLLVLLSAVSVVRHCWWKQNNSQIPGERHSRSIRLSWCCRNRSKDWSRRDGSRKRERRRPYKGLSSDGRSFSARTSFRARRRGGRRTSRCWSWVRWQSRLLGRLGFTLRVERSHKYCNNNNNWCLMYTDMNGRMFYLTKLQRRVKVEGP